jgi:hypothetical protein
MTDPLRVEELFTFASLGLDNAAYSKKQVTITSDKAITLLFEDRIVLIGVQPPTARTLPVRADAALLNNDGHTMALRKDFMFQIFNIEMKAKVDGTELREQILFWKWIKNNILAIVTPTDVYHWTIGQQEQPKKIFSYSLENPNISDYSANDDNTYFALVDSSGFVIIYSTEKNVSQTISSHAACFCQWKKTEENAEPVTLIITELYESKKIFMNELGTTGQYERQSIHSQIDENDIAVFLHANDRGILYLVTKNGNVILFSVDSGEFIFKKNITEQNIIAICSYGDGIVFITSTGKVVSVQLDDYITFVRQNLTNPRLANLLEKRVKLDTTKESGKSSFETFEQLCKNNPEEAVQYALSSNLPPLQVIERLAAQENIKSATAYALDAMKDDKPEYAVAVTRILELNFHSFPQVACAILQQEIFHHFDKTRVLAWLQKYEQYELIEKLFGELTVQDFASMEPKQALIKLREKMQQDQGRNVYFVVQVARKYGDRIGSPNMIRLFEEFKSLDGLFMYLSEIIDVTYDQDMIMKWIQVGVVTGAFEKVNAFLKSSDKYPVDRVVQFLMQDKSNLEGLIDVCVIHGKVKDIIEYLGQVDSESLRTYMMRNPEAGEIIQRAREDTN